MSEAAMSETAEPILPGSAFDQDGSHIDWIHEADVIESIHKLVVPVDVICIASKDARRGLLGRVLPAAAREDDDPDPIESTFSFSSLYSSAISHKATFHHYRLVVQNYIIKELPCIIVNIENLQFANAQQLLKTLEKNGKLQDFLLQPDERGRPNRRPSARGFVFRHRITKNFSADASKVEKWSRYTEQLKSCEAAYHLEHKFLHFEDSKAVRQCICDLGATGTTGSRLQKDIIAIFLRLRAEAFDSKAQAESLAGFERTLNAQQALKVFREQEAHEREAMFLHEEAADYEDNDPDIDMADYGDAEHDDGEDYLGEDGGEAGEVNDGHSEDDGAAFPAPQRQSWGNMSF